MNLFTFETTISKGISLCPKLTWRFSQVGLFVLMLFATWSCQQREQTIQFSQTDENVQATTQHYDLALDANALTVQLPSGKKSSLFFESPLSPAQAIGENAFLSTAEAYDFRLYTKDNHKAAYDLVFKPGADPEKARFRLQQAEKAKIDPHGNLLVPIDGGILKHSKPITYQEIDGIKKEVTSQFILDGDFLAFKLGAYNPAYAVVIDPELSFEDTPVDVFNASITLSASNPSPQDTGDDIIYVIKYSTQSNTNNFANAKIVVNIPY